MVVVLKAAYRLVAGRYPMVPVPGSLVMARKVCLFDPLIFVGDGGNVGRQSLGASGGRVFRGVLRFSGDLVSRGNLSSDLVFLLGLILTLQAFCISCRAFPLSFSVVCAPIKTRLGCHRPIDLVIHLKTCTTTTVE